MSAAFVSDGARHLEPNAFLTRHRAAEVLTAAGIPTSKTTLENLAVTGRGPPYSIVCGRAVYSRAQLAAWIESRLAPVGTT